MKETDNNFKQDGTLFCVPMISLKSSDGRLIHFFMNHRFLYSIPTLIIAISSGFAFPFGTKFSGIELLFAWIAELISWGLFMQVLTSISPVNYFGYSDITSIALKPINEEKEIADKVKNIQESAIKQINKTAVNLVWLIIYQLAVLVWMRSIGKIDASMTINAILSIAYYLFKIWLAMSAKNIEFFCKIFEVETKPIKAKIKQK